jgi:hypothetical protein
MAKAKRKGNAHRIPTWYKQDGYDSFHSTRHGPEIEHREIRSRNPKRNRSVWNKQERTPRYLRLLCSNRNAISKSERE